MEEAPSSHLKKKQGGGDSDSRESVLNVKSSAVARFVNYSVGRCPPYVSYFVCIVEMARRDPLLCRGTKARYSCACGIPLASSSLLGKCTM